MFYENLTNACAKKGTNVTALCEKLKISSGNTGNWKSGKVPSTKLLKRIALELGVTTDYLLGTEQKESVPITRDAETEEALDIMESLPEHLKKQALDYLRYLKDRSNKKESS